MGEGQHRPPAHRNQCLVRAAYAALSDTVIEDLLETLAGNSSYEAETSLTKRAFGRVYRFADFSTVSQLSDRTQNRIVDITLEELENIGGIGPQAA